MTMAGIENTMSWWLIALAIPVLFIAELVYFKIADRFDIIDKPNERSSHKSITLRGGGIIFYIAIVYFALIFGFHYKWFLLGLAGRGTGDALAETGGKYSTFRLWP